MCKRTLTAFLIAFVVPNMTAAASTYGKIAWESGSSMSNFDIKIMNLDGTEQVNLSAFGDPTNLYTDRDPHFKPDGSKILFTSSRPNPGGPGGLQRIYEMNPDGTGVTALSPGDFSVHYKTIEPKYSWDGSEVVFRMLKADPSGLDALTYFQVSSPSTTMTNIPTTGANDYWPSFSPDGQWVVFQRNFDPEPNPTTKIYRIRLNGTGLTQLTDGSHLDEMAYYSPDGLYIIFKRGGSNGENLDIYRMSAADGSGLVNLTNTTPDIEDAPAYSWEGAKIAFQSASNASDPNTTEIYIADPDGSNRVRLTNNSLIDFNPVFSPFNQCDFDGDADVDFNDFAAFASAWKTSSGQPGWNSKFDISVPKDSVIDVYDLSVFCDNWLISQ
ncbi:MAG: hypothetical protein ABSB25_03320 [Sedimentisphaerales bacterium]|jgi:Tol biopolymer transport system component